MDIEGYGWCDEKFLYRCVRHYENMRAASKRQQERNSPRYKEQKRASALRTQNKIKHKKLMKEVHQDLLQTRQ
jgi:hypothetical protein